SSRSPDNTTEEEWAEAKDAKEEVLSENAIPPPVWPGIKQMLLDAIQPLSANDLKEISTRLHEFADWLVRHDVNEISRPGDAHGNFTVGPVSRGTKTDECSTLLECECQPHLYPIRHGLREAEIELPRSPPLAN